jgi:hypothetical protein
MMCISHPRKCTCDTNSDKNIRDNTGGKDCIMYILAVDEYQRHSEDEPDKS